MFLVVPSVHKVVMSAEAKAHEKPAEKPKHLYSVGFIDWFMQKFTTAVKSLGEPMNGYIYRNGPFSISPPILETPVTNLTAAWNTARDDHDWDKCHILEEEYLRCAALVGLARAREECKPFWEDTYECLHKEKQQKRYLEIQEVRRRKKQWAAEKPLDDAEF